MTLFPSKRLEIACNIILSAHRTAEYKYWVGNKDCDAANEYLFDKAIELAEMKLTNEEMFELRAACDPLDYESVSRFMEEAREIVIHNERC